jgi:hypothetical protein
LKERQTGIAGFRAGILKLRGKRKELENGRRPLYIEEEDAVHILLKREG